jgi:dihydroneopterin aldolase
MSDSDVVFLNDMTFYAYHGIHSEEQALGQRFKVDVIVEVDLREAGKTDNLTDTVSYSSVFKRVKSVMEGPPRQLIEAVAEDIATSLLAEFEMATAVTVTIHKPGAPIRGAMFDTVGVRIRRHR